MALIVTPVGNRDLGNFFPNKGVDSVAEDHSDVFRYSGQNRGETLK